MSKDKRTQVRRSNLKNFLLQLIYGVLSISAIQQSNPAIHIYAFFFSHYSPSCSITSDQIQFLELYSRISLLIHSKYSNLHLTFFLAFPQNVYVRSYMQIHIFKTGLRLRNNTLGSQMKTLIISPLQNSQRILIETSSLLFFTGTDQ